MSTEDNVSAVGITAVIPINMAKADILSIPYIKGIKIEKPAMPPNAGKTPITIPNATPNKRYKKWGPEKIKLSEDISASIICL